MLKNMKINRDELTEEMGVYQIKSIKTVKDINGNDVSIYDSVIRKSKQDLLTEKENLNKRLAEIDAILSEIDKSDAEFQAKTLL